MEHMLYWIKLEINTILMYCLSCMPYAVRFWACFLLWKAVRLTNTDRVLVFPVLLHINSFNLYNNALKLVIKLSVFLKWKKCGTERLVNLPKFTQVLNGELRQCTCRDMALNRQIMLPSSLCFRGTKGFDRSYTNISRE